MPIGSDTQLQGLIDLANRGDAKAKDLLLDHACDRLLKLARRMFRDYPALRRHEATDDVFTKSLMRLSRALETVPVESVAHFFNLAGLQIRRELLDLKKLLPRIPSLTLLEWIDFIYYKWTQFYIANPTSQGFRTLL